MKAPCLGKSLVRLSKMTVHSLPEKPKTLPYLLCQMNLLLHGLEYPEIDPENALRFALREIGDKDRVDVIAALRPIRSSTHRAAMTGSPPLYRDW